MSAHSLAPRGDVGYAASAQYVPIRLQTADELATARDFDAFYALRGALRDDRQQHRHNRGDFEQPPATCELAARVNMSPRHMRRGLAALREHGKTLRTHDEHGRERLTIPDAVDNKDMRSQWTRCPDPAFLTLRHDRHLKRTFTAYIQSAWNERHDPRKAGKATEATVETIAAKIRRSPRTVQRHTAELEALGLLVREYRPGQPHLTRLLEPWNELAARPLLRPVPAPECGQECHPPPDRNVTPPRTGMSPPVAVTPSPTRPPGDPLRPLPLRENEIQNSSRTHAHAREDPPRDRPPEPEKPPNISPPTVTEKPQTIPHAPAGLFTPDQRAQLAAMPPAERATVIERIAQDVAKVRCSFRNAYQTPATAEPIPPAIAGELTAHELAAFEAMSPSGRASLLQIAAPAFATGDPILIKEAIKRLRRDGPPPPVPQQAPFEDIIRSLPARMDQIPRAIDAFRQTIGDHAGSTNYWEERCIQIVTGELDPEVPIQALEQLRAEIAKGTTIPKPAAYYTTILEKLLRQLGWRRPRRSP